jgi:hypothetical protein
VQCAYDQLDFAPCGPALAGCTAVVCASFTPPTAISGEHGLSVLLYDTDGTQLAMAGDSFNVDTTPPTTFIDSGPSGAMFQPSFTFEARDDDSFDNPLVTAQCSVTSVTAAANWTACPTTSQGGQTRIPTKLPDKHRDYRFQVRAVDDFGRPDATPAFVDFDPVPCGVTVRHPSNIRSLIASGMAVHVSCSFSSSVQVKFFLLGANGQKPLSPSVATNSKPTLGLSKFHGPKRSFSHAGRLKLFSFWAKDMAKFHSVIVCVEASNDLLDYGAPGFVFFALRH